MAQFYIAPKLSSSWKFHCIGNRSCIVDSKYCRQIIKLVGPKEVQGCENIVSSQANNIKA